MAKQNDKIEDLQKEFIIQNSKPLLVKIRPTCLFTARALFFFQKIKVKKKMNAKKIKKEMPNI